MPKKKRRSTLNPKLVRKVARLTKRPEKQVRALYRNHPAELLRTSRAKNVARSFERFRYERRLDALARPGGLRKKGTSRAVAQSFYQTVELVARDRLRSVYVDPSDKEYKGFAIEGRGRVIQRGPNKGFRRIVFDTITERLIDDSTARSIRKSSREMRIVTSLHREKFSVYRRLHKFFTPSELKRIRARKGKRPTIAELQKLAKRINKQWGFKIEKVWTEVFGGYGGP